MKVTIIVVCFCISLLLPEILCGTSQDRAKAIQRLRDMASKNETINEILIPLSLVKNGSVGFTYKGIVLKPIVMEPKEVAIKFIHKTTQPQKEYKIYWYLNAVDNENVDGYGIPAVYYFGQWENFYLLAITFLDKSLQGVNTPLRELDGLIICRDFVKASKYIHGRGIRINGVSTKNIMFRRNNVFITNYKEAQKMHRDSEGMSLDSKHMQPLSKSVHVQSLRLLKDDWQSFLNTMCVRFNQDIKNMRDTDGLEKIFYEFNKHVSDKKTLLLPYDNLYKMINDQIQSRSPHQPAVVSFIEKGNYNKAWWESVEIFNISSISGPSEMHIPVYDDVRICWFTEKYNVYTTSPILGDSLVTYELEMA